MSVIFHPYKARPWSTVFAVQVQEDNLKDVAELLDGIVRPYEHVEFKGPHVLTDAYKFTSGPDGGTWRRVIYPQEWLLDTDSGYQVWSNDDFQRFYSGT